MEIRKIQRVIIVDDSRDFIDGLRLLFKYLPQYKVISVAYDGSEIIDNAELGNADLLLLDVNMPILNGIKAAQQINFIYPSLKMIAITLNHDSVYLEELIGAGFKGFVDKANIVNDLADTLQKVCNNQYIFPKQLLNTGMQESSIS